MKEKIEYLRRNNQKRLDRYTNDGGEDTIYLDGKDRAFEEVLELFSGNPIEVWDVELEKWIIISPD